MPKVSVIVPVYNTKKYLRQCIDSVKNQSLHDIEIILVDDGSQDGSGDILDEYACSDSRIKVIHKKNEGLSCARNDGIAIATAPYILLVDSDDWVELDTCEITYNIAEENSADLVFFRYLSRHSDGTVGEKKTKLREGVLSEREALLYNLLYTVQATMCLYKKSLFDEILFPAGKYHEDVGTTHRIIHVSKKTCFVNKALYNYRIGRPGSITSVRSTRIHPDLQEMLIRRIMDLHNWGFDDYAQKCAIAEMVKYGWRSSEQQVCVDLIRKIKCIPPSCFPWKHKVMYMIFRISPQFFDYICIKKGERYC